MKNRFRNFISRLSVLVIYDSRFYTDIAVYIRVFSEYFQYCIRPLCQPKKIYIAFFIGCDFKSC